MYLVEVYYEDEEIRQIISQIDSSTQSILATENEVFQCYEELKTEEIDDVHIVEDNLVKEDPDPISEDELLIEALKDTYNNKCFQKRVNYWTYILCPYNKVEQAHFEYTVKKGKRTLFPEQVISLGTYNEKLSTIETHIYDHGDSGRKTIVKFKCPSKKAKVTKDELGKITRVREVEAYNYEIAFATSMACQKNKQKILDSALGKRIEAKENFTEEELNLEVRRILKLIETQCFLHYKGWWSYEVCLSHKIRQFHKNKDTTLDEFILGHLELIEGVPNLTIEDSQKHARKVVTQRFTKGTECDVTGTRRSTTVVFKCFDNVGFVEIMSLEESVSCGYEIVISLPLLCSLPGFSSSGTMLENVAVQKTICFPENKIDLVEK